MVNTMKITVTLGDVIKAFDAMEETLPPTCATDPATCCPIAQAIKRTTGLDYVTVNDHDFITFNGYIHRAKEQEDIDKASLVIGKFDDSDSLKKFLDQVALPVDFEIYQAQIL